MHLDTANIFTQQRADELLKDYKLTPATLGHKLSSGKWIPKQFLLYAAMKVARAIAKGSGRLIISWPPRHGKSQLITKYTPLWCLEHFPDYEIVISSYGADLSTDFGREIRDHILDHTDLLNVRLRQDSKRVAKFLTQANGSVTSVGLGGPITGRGADLLLIDDYIKEIKEAMSITHRDYVYDWFRTTAMTRLEPNATVVIVATRWHRDDLVGRLLRSQPDVWDHVVIPALAEENDLFGREPGEALFPERFDKEYLQEQRELFGSFFFNAIYQQNPSSDEDKKADREWINLVDITPNPLQMRHTRVWDFAGTKGGGDYTAGGLHGFCPRTNNFYIENMIRKQISPGEIEFLVRQTAESDGINTEIVIEQEPGASGKQVIDHYTNNVLPEFRVKGVPTVTSKYIRGHPYLAAAESGKVFMVKGSWNETYLEEFDEIPDGAEDDQFDTSAIAYNEMTGGLKAAPIWGREIKRTNHPDATESVTGLVFGR